MKKTIALIALLALLCSTACAECYPTTAVISQIDYSEDSATCVLFTGIAYTFYEVEDLCVGDIVSLYMWDAETPDTIRDDEILDVVYSGYLTGDALSQWFNH